MQEPDKILPQQGPAAQLNSRSGRKRKASEALKESLSTSRNDREMMALSKRIENTSAPEETNTTVKSKQTSVRKNCLRNIRSRAWEVQIMLFKRGVILHIYV